MSNEVRTKHKKMIDIGRIPNEMIDQIEIEKELCSRNLFDFVLNSWEYIDPDTFINNWHIECICEHLEALYTRQIKKLVINIPPRFMKSILCCVAFPAWIWIREPSFRFFMFSYVITLAIRDSVKCRRLIESEWYQLRWGKLSNLPDDKKVILTTDQNVKQRYETTQMGYRICSSVGGTVTGEGGDINVCDDPHNVQEAESATIREGTVNWWKESVASRVNKQDTGALIVSQRTHERDLSGVMLEAGYYPLVLPMEYEPTHTYHFPNDQRTRENELLWPKRFDKHFIADMKNEMGEYAYAGQYQQRPTSRKGGLFNVDRLMFCTKYQIPVGGTTVAGWDLAASDKEHSIDTAYIVRVLLRKVGKVYFILNVERFRERPGQAKKHIERIVRNDCNNDDYNVIRESFPEDPGSAGKMVAADLKDLLDGYPVRTSPESGSKEARAESVAAQVDIGNVYLVKAEWNAAFIDELRSFPKGKFKDQVDAMSRSYHEIQAVERIHRMQTPAVYGGSIEGRKVTPDAIERECVISTSLDKEKQSPGKQFVSNTEKKRKLDVPLPRRAEA